VTPTSRWQPPPQPGPPIIITPRQADVLDRLHLGYSNDRIGRELYITLNSVKTHVKALLLAARATNRAHLVAITCARTVVVRGDRGGWAA
jgi:DNA-binding NarL/FixJ family response regulator